MFFLLSLSVVIFNDSPKRWKCTISRSLRKRRGATISGSFISLKRLSYTTLAFCSAACYGNSFNFRLKMKVSVHFLYLKILQCMYTAEEQKAYRELILLQ